MAVPIPAAQQRFVCAIHPRDFNEETGWFNSTSFKPSSDGSGISVFDCECATRISGTVCEHLARYYSNQTQLPGVYWLLPLAALPSGCIAEQETSTTGDECHHNLKNWSKGAARFYFKTISLETFYICDVNGVRHLERGDLATFFGKRIK